MARTKPGKSRSQTQKKVQPLMKTHVIARKCSPVFTGMKRRSAQFPIKRTPTTHGPQFRRIYRFYGIQAQSVDGQLRSAQFYTRAAHTVQSILRDLLTYKTNYMYGALNGMVELQQHLIGYRPITPQLTQRLTLIIPPKPVLNVFFGSMLRKIRSLPYHLHIDNPHIGHLTQRANQSFIDRCWEVRAQIQQLVNNLQEVPQEHQRKCALATTSGIITWIYQLNQPLDEIQAALMRCRQRSIQYQISAEERYNNSSQESSSSSQESQSQMEMDSFKTQEKKLLH